MNSTPPPLDLSRWSPSITRYADWLVADHHADAREWEHRINSAHPPAVEGAVAEAVAWDYLGNRVGRIRRFRPESGAARSPDFLCTTSSGDFVVEVTNLSRTHVTNLTHLDDSVRPGSGSRNYDPWDRHLKSVLSDKAKQGQGLQVPYVVFIATLHVSASVVLCSRPLIETVLHSRPHLRGFIDQDGDAVGEVENVTDFATAAFTRKYSVEPARKHVSALLVGGFGTYPDVRVLGLLHPEAERPLHAGAIGSTPLCYWREWPPRDEIEVGWTDEPTQKPAAKRSDLID